MNVRQGLEEGFLRTTDVFRAEERILDEAVHGFLLCRKDIDVKKWHPHGLPGTGGLFFGLFSIYAILPQLLP